VAALEEVLQVYVLMVFALPTLRGLCGFLQLAFWVQAFWTGWRLGRGGINA
jgi:hypothetical protein